MPPPKKEVGHLVRLSVATARLPEPVVCLLLSLPSCQNVAVASYTSSRGQFLALREYGFEPKQFWLSSENLPSNARSIPPCREELEHFIADFCKLAIASFEKSCAL